MANCLDRLDISGFGVKELTGSIAVPVGQWYHLAVVYTMSTMSIYVNGELSANATGMYGSFSGYNEDKYFGMTGKTGRTGDVLLDEIKLYKIALTQDQIKIDMAAVGVPSSGIC
jgi:hypothetical protein